MKQKNEVLGKSFVNLLDESEQDRLVRSQLIEMIFEDSEAAEEPSLMLPPEEVIDAEDIIDEEDFVPADAIKPPQQDAPVTIDDPDLLDAFIQETREHLDCIEEKIIKLEQAPDAALIDEIFRAMHTMKGSSSFFGFLAIESLSHHCESLLDKVRSNKLTISSDLIDILLASADILTKQIDEISAAAAQQGKENVPFQIPQSEIDIAPLLNKIGETNRDGGPEETKGQNKAIDESQSLITDEMIDSYISESMALLTTAEKSILDLENQPENQDLLADLFRSIHTIKGNAGFLGYESHEQICTHMEDFLTSLREGEKKISHRAVSVMLNTIDSLNKLIFSIRDPNNDGDDINGIEPMGELLVKMGVVSEEDIDCALEVQERRVGEILIQEGKVSRDVVEEALEKQKAAAKKRGIQDKTSLERKDIRVDVTKLDKLFDLMGELITAEAIVVKNPELEGLELEGFNHAANYLGKITRQMQEITMSVRMIPLEGLFNKTRRAVRDLSRRFSKEIEIVTEGQETEMDRNVIEELSDPMTHIIRNAIDHGIEDAEVRKAAGKKPKGMIYLGARHEGSEIWITIKDDGQGLDRKKILAKAVERHLMKAEEAAILDDTQVWRFLLEPGFSTAEKISELSGRGVGMDVVKQNIENLRGKIDINTTPGKETEFILKIPLSLSILDGIIIKVGNVHYAVPLSDIREFQRANQAHISKTKTNLEVLRLRDEIIPVVRMSDFFRVGNGSSQQKEQVFLIIQVNNRPTALLVDEIIGYHQIVMKSLPDFMGHIKGLSGCSIMGNGDVTFIINPSALIVDESI